jgi:hypothetical protein
VAAQLNSAPPDFSASSGGTGGPGASAAAKEVLHGRRYTFNSRVDTLKLFALLHYRDVALFGVSEAVLSAAAARSRVNIPAQKPSRTQMINPHGDEPTSLSTPQPMVPPTATPDMNPAES